MFVGLDQTSLLVRKFNSNITVLDSSVFSNVSMWLGVCVHRESKNTRPESLLLYKCVSGMWIQHSLHEHWFGSNINVSVCVRVNYQCMFVCVHESEVNICVCVSG